MRVRRTLAAAAVLPVVLTAAACAPESDGGSSASDPSASASPSADACATDALALKTAGQLTIGTDSPAYEPWFVDNDPTNGKGYESAVAYAVAEQLGFSKDQVKWIKVPFNTSYAPGAKDFDFDINQISITPERAEGRRLLRRLLLGRPGRDRAQGHQGRRGRPASTTSRASASAPRPAPRR